MSVDVNFQFEYIVPMSKWDFQLDKYVDYGQKRWLTILNTFEHHYTGERMCKIREDWVAEDGHSLSFEEIVREQSVLDLMRKWVL